MELVNTVAHYDEATIYGRKKVYSTGPWCRCYKNFSDVIYVTNAYFCDFYWSYIESGINTYKKSFTTLAIDLIFEGKARCLPHLPTATATYLLNIETG
jgi:hypothetical protein